MKRTIVLGLVSLCISSGAWAAGQARPHAGGSTPDANKAVTRWTPETVASQADYTSGLFRSYLGDALSYAKAYAKQETDASTAAASASAAAAKKAENEFKSSEAKLQAQIVANGDAIRAKEKDLEKYELELRSAEKILNAGVVSPADEKRKKEAEQQISRLKIALETERPALEALKQKVNPAQDALATAQADYSNKMLALQGTLSPESQAALRMKGFETGVNLMFERMKNSTYDAKLLLTDFDTLKNEYKLAELGIDLQTLRDGLGNRLSNTLMGNYVNSQVMKAMRQICSIRSQCDLSDSENQAVAIDSLIKKILEEPAAAAGSSPASPASSVAQ